jgi:hypothetical protein
METKLLYAYGSNPAGYLPVGLPGEADDFSEAKAGLVEEITSRQQDVQMGLGQMCVENGDSEEDITLLRKEDADISAAIEVINTWTEPSSITVCGTQYWVQQV